MAKLTSDIGIVDALPAGPEHEPIFRHPESGGKDKLLSILILRRATTHGSVDRNDRVVLRITTRGQAFRPHPGKVDHGSCRWTTPGCCALFP